MGSDMAECHPVAFRWVMKAKENGAKLIHIDPRFTRTSAMADIYVPIRAGSDVVFLGGLINWVIQNERYFKEYVLNYTNASTLINPNYRDSEDLEGVFSGFNPDSRTYDSSSWQYDRTQAQQQQRNADTQVETIFARRRKCRRHFGSCAYQSHNNEPNERGTHPEFGGSKLNGTDEHFAYERHQNSDNCERAERKADGPRCFMFFCRARE